MSAISVTVRNCDVCKLKINKDVRYINANFYAKDFHIMCLMMIDALTIIKILGLDEIKVMVNNDWATAIKLIEHNALGLENYKDK